MKELKKSYAIWVIFSFQQLWVYY